MKISARNVLKGKVVDVALGQTTAHVRIDIGGSRIVTASITNAVEWAGKVNGLRARVNAALRVQTRSMEKRLLYFFANVKDKAGFD